MFERFCMKLLNLFHESFMSGRILSNVGRNRMLIFLPVNNLIFIVSTYHGGPLANGSFYCVIFMDDLR